MPLSTFAIDVGSPKRGRLGWASAGMDGTTESGSDLDAVIDRIATKLSVEAVALGFEAPMFIPLQNAPMRLTNARSGEGSRAWSAGAGCGVLATGLPITAYILEKLRRAVPDASASLDWQRFDSAPRRLLLFEAFVSGKDKGGTHVDDAALAVRHLVGHRALPEIESALQDDGPVLSLLGAILLRTGWSADTALLAQPCLVIRPASVKGRTRT